MNRRLFFGAMFGAASVPVAAKAVTGTLEGKVTASPPEWQDLYLPDCTCCGPACSEKTYIDFTDTATFIALFDPYEQVQIARPVSTAFAGKLKKFDQYRISGTVGWWQVIADPETRPDGRIAVITRRY